ncbi:F-box protein [Cardamine amara subsp. amara]|uniref:F-box protein n=1 Tax=Cardamine amara subsp. amara TaxID=228776 RepID=A0ABD1A2S7_CARAN
MKRRNDEKDMFCSSRSKLNPIPKKVLCEERQLIDEKEERSRIKVDDPIPLDLEVAILTRLPAKSVIKFLCVSKMWSSIIRSQRFVSSSYAMSSTMRSRFIITISSGDRCLLVFSSSYESEISSCLATNLDMKVPSVSGLCGSAAYCASVHGLVGFTTSGFTFTVCNPCINKFTILPCVGARTSWGYDPVVDQFKTLTMISYPYRPPNYTAHEVLRLGGGAPESNKVISPPYFTVTKSVCINGFVYYGAWTPTRSQNPVIVCFDVRHEKLSFIKAPLSVICWEGESILINYKGKLASIARHPYATFQSFDLWILEDVKKQDWSRQSFQLPFSLGMGKDFTSPGTNKAGEIIFAPKLLPLKVQPFYIFYYNVDRKDIRRVRLLGIADDQDFRHRYGIGIGSYCYVSISAQHVESIASL